MDIYKWAEEYNQLADYYANGCIYKCQAYGAALKNKDSPDISEIERLTYNKMAEDGIEIVDSMTGESIGYAQRV